MQILFYSQKEKIYHYHCNEFKRYRTVLVQNSQKVYYAEKTIFQVSYILIHISSFISLTFLEACSSKDCHLEKYTDVSTKVRDPFMQICWNKGCHKPLPYSPMLMSLQLHRGAVRQILWDRIISLFSVWRHDSGSFGWILLADSAFLLLYFRGCLII